MRRIILELIREYYEAIVEDWTAKLIKHFGDKLTEAQIQTFVESSLQAIVEVIETSDYEKADSFLIEAYTFFTKAKLNLLEISQFFSYGRYALLHYIDNIENGNYDPLIILGFIDEIIEQIYARYGVLHQNAQMKELAEDRDRLANKLEVNQRYLKNLLHSSETAICVIDQDEKITSWNKGAEILFDYSEDEVIGKTSLFLMPEGDNYLEELKYIRTEVKSKGGVKIFDTERKTKDGRIIPVQLNIAKLPSKKGEYVGRTVIIKDQTQVKKLQRQVDQSEKLAVIGQLAAGVAHEIGNPLAAISSLVQLIQRRNSDEALKEQLSTIRENIDRISKIVRELVDFSRPPGYESVYVQVTDVIKTAVGIVKYDKRVKQVKFETDFDHEIPPIKIIPDQLLQVFVNILINALDAIGGTGTISVISHKDKENIYIDIIDNGCGMPTEVVEKIFDPFYTTKEVGKGTGLGLSVSYGIINKFKGDILVTSKIKKEVPLR